LAKNLKQIMHDLASESHEEIFSKLSKSDLKKYRDICFVPQFKEDNTCYTTKKEEITNFKKIIYENEKKITSLSSYKIVKNILKNTIRKKHEAYEKKIVLDLNDVVKKTIFDFLTSYQNELNLKKINVNPYDITYKKLKEYLQNELFTVFCFTTLRHFDSQIKSLLLPPDQLIRLRTEEEFSVICDIKDAMIQPKINTNFQKIKYIIGTHISKTKINEQKIKESFSKFLFALKIFHEGNVQFGGVYYSDSVSWDAKPTICIKSEPILEKPALKYRLDSENLTQKDFEKFVTNFFKINLTKGKYVFLVRSIKRFSQAIENEDDLDKMIDFVTCLESLYSSKEQQLSFRFAMRVAILLGQNNYEKITLQEFILQIYNLRSKIIHGDDIPAIEIDDKEIHLDDCLKILENIARISIKLFLQLINDFKTKEELHQMLDNSIYDIDSQKTFSKHFKKLQLKPIIISK